MTPSDTSVIPTGSSQGWSVFRAEKGRWAYAAWCQGESEMGFGVNEHAARHHAERALARLVDKRRRETLLRVK